MILIGRTKSKITKDKNGKNVLGLEMNDSVLYKFVLNKSFGQLIDISPKNFKCYILKTFDSEFSYIVVWFPGQNSKPLATEDKINITLVINQIVKYKK